MGAGGHRLRIVAPDGEPFESWFDDPVAYDADLVDVTGVVRSFGAGREGSARRLRFVDPAHVRDLLGEAGFVVESWSGDWDGSPVLPTSPEVVVLARS